VSVYEVDAQHCHTECYTEHEASDNCQQQTYVEQIVYILKNSL